jgi:pyrroline-5-carboxylate reductase
MKIGLIGATGWLGSAMGAHLLDKGLVVPADLILLNRGGPRDTYHGRREVVWASGADDLAARSDVIILSVRPQDWADLSLRAPGKLVLSFLAGTGIAALAACGGRIVRVMPNAAAEIGASYSPWVAGPGVTDADRQAVRSLLSAIGEQDELADESQIDLMTAASGSGAAYPALMAVAIADWLAAQGVERAIAWRTAGAMVCGGARLLEGRIDTAPAMVAAYRDYRGTTAAGIEAAEAVGFGASLAAALDAATAAARKLGQG